MLTDALTGAPLFDRPGATDRRKAEEYSARSTVLPSWWNR